MADVKVFYRRGCPYCKKVFDYLETSSLSFKKYNIQKEANERLVRTKLGSSMVPAVYFPREDLWMQESDDIIEKLKRTKA